MRQSLWSLCLLIYACTAAMVPARPLENPEALKAEFWACIDNARTSHLISFIHRGLHPLTPSPPHCSGGDLASSILRSGKASTHELDCLVDHGYAPRTEDLLAAILNKNWAMAHRLVDLLPASCKDEMWANGPLEANIFTRLSFRTFHLVSDIEHRRRLLWKLCTSGWAGLEALKAAVVLDDADTIAQLVCDGVVRLDNHFNYPHLRIHLVSMSTFKKLVELGLNINGIFWDHEHYLNHTINAHLQCEKSLTEEDLCHITWLLQHGAMLNDGAQLREMWKRIERLEGSKAKAAVMRLLIYHKVLNSRVDAPMYSVSWELFDGQELVTRTIRDMVTLWAGAFSAGSILYGLPRDIFRAIADMMRLESLQSNS